MQKYSERELGFCFHLHEYKAVITSQSSESDKCSVATLFLNISSLQSWVWR